MPSTIVIRKKLDMTPGAVPTVVHRSQYDSDFTIIFELFARTGEFVIESGTTARLRGTKTSGTGYSVEIPLNISTKTVTIAGDAQMTVAAGNNIFEVVLYLGDLEICSSNFVLAIERAAMDADTITDETVVPELEHLEEYTQQAAEQAARDGAAYAQSWAVGGTGKREGEDTNNAKYWSEQAQGAVSGVASFNGRTGAVVPAANDYTAAQIKRSGGTVESALASVESVNMNQNTRLAGLESTVAGHGPRITAAENSIASQGARLTTAESNITSQGTRLTTAEGDIDSLKSKFPVESGNLDASYIDGLTRECMTGGYINYPDVYIGLGIVLTIQWTTSMYFFQIIIGHNGSIRTRNYTGGTWSNWNNTATVTYKDYSTTTGTELYGGYYYGNISNVAISGKTLIGVTVVSADGNVPAFCSMISNNIIRAYSTVASKTVTIRCIYQG